MFCAFEKIDIIHPEIDLYLQLLTYCVKVSSLNTAEIRCKELRYLCFTNSFMCSIICWRESVQRAEQEYENKKKIKKVNFT